MLCLDISRRVADCPWAILRHPLFWFVSPWLVRLRGHESVFKFKPLHEVVNLLEATTVVALIIEDC